MGLHQIDQYVLGLMAFFSSYIFGLPLLAQGVFTLLFVVGSVNLGAMSLVFNSTIEGFNMSNPRSIIGLIGFTTFFFLSMFSAGQFLIYPGYMLSKAIVGDVVGKLWDGNLCYSSPLVSDAVAGLYNVLKTGNVSQNVESYCVDGSTWGEYFYLPVDASILLVYGNMFFGLVTLTYRYNTHLGFDIKLFIASIGVILFNIFGFMSITVASTVALIAYSFFCLFSVSRYRYVSDLVKPDSDDTFNYESSTYTKVKIDIEDDVKSKIEEIEAKGYVVTFLQDKSDSTYRVMITKTDGGITGVYLFSAYTDTNSIVTQLDRELLKSAIKDSKYKAGEWYGSKYSDGGYKDLERIYVGFTPYLKKQVSAYFNIIRNISRGLVQVNSLMSWFFKKTMGFPLEGVPIELNKFKLTNLISYVTGMTWVQGQLFTLNETVDLKVFYNDAEHLIVEKVEEDKKEDEDVATKSVQFKIDPTTTIKYTIPDFDTPQPEFLTVDLANDKVYRTQMNSYKDISYISKVKVEDGKFIYVLVYRDGWASYRVNPIKIKALFTEKEIKEGVINVKSLKNILDNKNVEECVTGFERDIKKGSISIPLPARAHINENSSRKIKMVTARGEATVSESFGREYTRSEEKKAFIDRCKKLLGNEIVDTLVIHVNVNGFILKSERSKFILRDIDEYTPINTFGSFDGLTFETEGEDKELKDWETDVFPTIDEGDKETNDNVALHAYGYSDLIRGLEKGVFSGQRETEFLWDFESEKSFNETYLKASNEYPPLLARVGRDAYTLLDPFWILIKNLGFIVEYLYGLLSQYLKQIFSVALTPIFAVPPIVVLELLVLLLFVSTYFVSGFGLAGRTWVNIPSSFGPVGIIAKILAVPIFPTLVIFPGTVLVLLYATFFTVGMSFAFTYKSLSKVFDYPGLGGIQLAFTYWLSALVEAASDMTEVALDTANTLDFDRRGSGFFTDSNNIDLLFKPFKDFTRWLNKKGRAKEDELIEEKKDNEKEKVD